MPAASAAIGVAMDVTDEAQVDAGVAKVVEAFGGVDILVSNAGIQIVAAARRVRLRRLEEDAGDPPRRRLPDDRAPACAQMYAAGSGGSIIYMGSVHSKEASVLKAPYVTAKHGLIGLAKVVAKEGAEHGVRANVICPGFVRTPLVDKQIPEQAKELGISEEDVIKKVMLKDTVDGEFTTVDDVAAGRAVLRRLPDQRADRPVARRQPRLVHAVIGPEGPSVRKRRPGRHRAGLASKPGGRSREDVALQAQLLVLAAQPNELLAVGRRHNLTVLLPAALLSVGLADPVADRLGGRLELTRELGRISLGVDQINHLPPEFWRVRRACLGHGVLLLRKPEGLHQGGSASAIFLPRR